MLPSPPAVRTTSTEGVLLVDKPSGMTSHDVVTTARRVLQTRRVGHTGTLDPFATGLLILLVGRATRLAQFIDDEPKIYDATIQFGSETTTDDLIGDVTSIAEFPQSAAIDRAIVALTGSILQRPPDYSAKKIGGRRAYAAARVGAPLSLESVPITVHEWIVRGRDHSSIDVTIRCGGGTYIRALARVLGRSARSAAHLAALRRVQSGPFHIRDAMTVDDLEEGKTPTFISLRSAVRHLPAQELCVTELARVRHGNPIAASADGPLVALVDSEGELIAIAERHGATLQPRLVLTDG